MNLISRSVGTIALLLTFALQVDGSAQSQVPHFASGIKIGEVTNRSAIVWVRCSKQPEPDFEMLEIFTKGLPVGEKSQTEMPADVVPGVACQVRLLFWRESVDSRKTETQWKQVSEADDFVHQFALDELEPDSSYHVEVQARLEESKPVTKIEGRFKTAPLPNDSKKIQFIVSTCQAIRSIDSGSEGHIAYKQMLDLKPDFFVHTGDILYYDKVPLCKSLAQAQAKWSLMFGYQFNKDFHANVPSYFMKDDHDTLKNDCWPGQTYGDLTFEQGQEIFRRQVPMADRTYRTIRWGKDVQIWLTENRDYRSSNRDPDGPDKTILGVEQKSWLKETIANSDATFKFIISPGPIVGPDKAGKKDNHSNSAFAHEGQELRNFLAKQENTYVICGDRHWQYSSKDPATGLLEFGCGPINDEHRFGGNPGNVPEMHRYFSPTGGFLLISVDGASAKAEWIHADVSHETGQPKVLFVENLPHSD